MVGLDYADQRFYASAYGRFNSPDPYKASSSTRDPGSWNRCAYVGDDPINYNYPRGLARCHVVGAFTTRSDPNGAMTEYTTAEVQCTSALRGALGTGYSLFLSAFAVSVNGDGVREDAIAGNDGQGTTLHSAEVDTGNSDYYHFHFDIFKGAITNPVGLIGHFLYDVVGGHLGTPCLDPVWQR